MGGLASDFDFIQAGFVEGNDFVLVAGEHALVEVVAFSQQGFAGLAPGLGQQFTDTYWRQIGLIC
jgi:hypothetical protein